jgi:hypothetical protein
LPFTFVIIETGQRIERCNITRTRAVGCLVQYARGEWRWRGIGAFLAGGLWRGPQRTQAVKLARLFLCLSQGRRDKACGAQRGAGTQKLAS